jgi:hypothetical protein
MRAVAAICASGSSGITPGGWERGFESHRVEVIAMLSHPPAAREPVAYDVKSPLTCNWIKNRGATLPGRVRLPATRISADSPKSRSAISPL